MKKIKIALLLTLIFSCSIFSQEVIDLFKGNVPNSIETSIKEVNTSGMFRNVIAPTIEVFAPEKEKNTGVGIIICPGGGYSVVVYQGEGVSTAKKLAENGITAFVLKYRLPDDAIMTDKKIGPLQDAQQAMKVVRENADKWGLDKNKIGIMGFSAGGHLASTVATHFQKSYIENEENTSLRPDFQILVYPVISMQENLTHAGSRNQLLGSNPSKEVVDEFSNELKIDDNAPPAYLTHAADDNVVDVDNVIKYFEALRHHKVQVEMHIYPLGGHGFVLRQKGWMDPLLKWMENSKLTAQ